MAVLVTQVLDASQDGLGRSTALGTCFLRRVRINLNGAATSYALQASSDLGAQRILYVQSIVAQTVDTEYVSAQPAGGASVTITASSNTAIFDVYALVQGL